MAYHRRKWLLFIAIFFYHSQQLQHLNTGLKHQKQWTMLHCEITHADVNTLSRGFKKWHEKYVVKTFVTTDEFQEATVLWYCACESKQEGYHLQKNPV